nr:hypothetical protein [Desulforamulus aquiferis]
MPWGFVNYVLNQSGQVLHICLSKMAKLFTMNAFYGNHQPLGKKPLGNPAPLKTNGEKDASPGGAPDVKRASG